MSVTTYDFDGKESTYSNEVRYAIDIFANLQPTAVDDSITTNEYTPVNINVIANDIDYDGTVEPATVAVVSFLPVVPL